MRWLLIVVIVAVLAVLAAAQVDQRCSLLGGTLAGGDRCAVICGADPLCEDLPPGRLAYDESSVVKCCTGAALPLIQGTLSVNSTRERLTMHRVLRTSEGDNIMVKVIVFG